MANDLPAPMSPIDCDLRGYEFMPLFGAKLFSSRLYSKALRDPRAGLAALKLWWAAWQQCPAGSLPADDDDLCVLADFGMDMKGWRKAKPLALHGFVLCSDGRYYHPILCEEAKQAFERRRKERERKARNRAARVGQEWDLPSPVPSPVPPLVPPDVPRDKTRKEPGHDAGRDGDVRSDRTGQDRTGQKEESSSTEMEGDARVVSLRPPPMPTLGDPPGAWSHLADRLPDGTAKVERDDDGIVRPVCAGVYLDITAEMVAGAARIDAYSRPLDWKTLCGWLRDGLESHDHILPVIRRIAERPGYEPPQVLRYFDGAIRAKRGAA